MHLILMTRGIQQSQEIWQKFMETQMFNFKQIPIKKNEKGEFLKNPDGTYQKEEYDPLKHHAIVQGALRPIQLWEYVFPQESLGEVLGMMNLQNCFPLRKEISLPAWILRKTMGAKPIPQEFIDKIKGKQSWEITHKYVPMGGMAVYPVGIREDEVHDYTFPNGQGFHQEGL